MISDSNNKIAFELANLNPDIVYFSSIILGLSSTLGIMTNQADFLSVSLNDASIGNTSTGENIATAVRKTSGRKNPITMESDTRNKRVGELKEDIKISFELQPIKDTKVGFKVPSTTTAIISVSY